jgi:hypothetical protein
MHIQPQSPHHTPFLDDERERGGTHDNDGFVLSAHREKSQGRPRTTSSSQLISQIGLPDRVSQQGAMSPDPEGSRQGRTAVSCPDNRSAYRSTVHAFACRALGVRHLRTRPYRPRTNGKAERFIRTLIAGWSYGAIYSSSRERTAALDGWLWTYNHHRPHGALGHKPPIARLNDLNNPAGAYS